MRKFVLILFLSLVLFLLSPTLCSCSASINQTRQQKVMINDINYNSLSEAVQNAKDGDKIEIYNDISDNKNIVIDKSITIVGKPNSSNIKPIFYGSLTIDTNKEDSNVSIENIQIVNPGQNSDNTINNTLCAIHLIDGGLNVKNCKIMPSDKNYDSKACGIVLSRKANSINNMPIVIAGNSFGCYKYSDDHNAALLIKNNKVDEYKNLNLNTQLIADKNSFDFSDACNQIVQIDFSQDTLKYPFILSSHADFILNCLKNNGQSSDFNKYILVNAETVNTTTAEPVYILPTTSLTVSGTKETDFSGITFKVAGNVLIEVQIKNATFERTNDTASIIFNENIDKSNVTVQ